jgi:ADP-heptose:LPS heptosyltransferase
MNFAWMRRIDSTIGKPLLALFRLWVRPPASLSGDWAPAQVPERVICAKFIGIGSVVLSLPLLRRLKDSGARVAVWTFPGPAALLRQTGLADEIWVIDPSLRRFLPTLLKTIRAARRFGAQAFLDMEPTANFSALLSVLSGARLRAGFMSAKPSREALLTHLVALAPEHHMIEHLLRMGSLLGLPPPDGPVPLPELPSLGAPAVPAPAFPLRIVVNVNASDLSWHRLWPDSYWGALCRALLSDPRVELVFPGTAAEAARVQAVIDALSPEQRARASNIAGRTSLAELVGLIGSSSLVVTIDSGIMHLACLTPTPIVALFGPETPTLFAPRSPNARVLWAQLPCSPCLTVAAEKVTACRDNQCMKRIDPQQVLAVCRERLARRSGTIISGA